MCFVVLDAGRRGTSSDAVHLCWSLVCVVCLLWSPVCWLLWFLNDLLKIWWHLLPLRADCCWPWPSGSFVPIQDLAHMKIPQVFRVFGNFRIPELHTHTKPSFSFSPPLSTIAVYSLPYPIKPDFRWKFSWGLCVSQTLPLFHPDFSYFINSYHHFPQNCSTMPLLLRCNQSSSEEVDEEDDFRIPLFVISVSPLVIIQSREKVPSLAGILYSFFLRRKESLPGQPYW